MTPTQRSALQSKQCRTICPPSACLKSSLARRLKAREKLCASVQTACRLFAGLHQHIVETGKRGQSLQEAITNTLMSPRAGASGVVQAKMDKCDESSIAITSRSHLYSLKRQAATEKAATDATLTRCSQLELELDRVTRARREAEDANDFEPPKSAAASSNVRPAKQQKTAHPKCVRFVNQDVITRFAVSGGVQTRPRT